MFSPSHVTFLSFIMFSIILVMSSSSWLISWVGVELNTLCFIPMMLESKTGREGESAIKYFLTQTFASILLLIGILGLKFSSTSLFLSTLMLALLIKMGAAPFHSWVVAVGENLNWISLYLMLTLQKVNPLVLLISSQWKWDTLMIVVALSAVVGAIMGLSQTSLRKLLIFSSINHLSWLFMAMTGGLILLSTYFSIYCILLFPIILISKSINASYLGQLPSLPLSSYQSLVLMLSLLSLGGLPPFFGFFPKWLVIHEFISSSNFVLGATLVMMSLFTLYYYLRISYSSLTLSKSLLEPRWSLSTIPTSVLITSTISLLGFIVIFIC